MKKENDEITDLFRTRLADAGMTVRDGFWEELSQDIPVACQHRRRLIFFRVAAAASVLLVLAASSATFWFSNMQLPAVFFIFPLSLLRNQSYTFFTYPTGISTMA